MSPLTVTTDRVQFDVRQGIAAMLRNVVQLSLTSAAIAVTATGFTRTDGGSFIDDGFADGAELTTTGYANAANNTLTYIRGVSAADLVVQQPDGAVPLVVEAAGAAATLALKYPSMRDLERGFTATPGIPWARLTLLRAPNASQRLGVGINPSRLYKGWAQVSLFYPRDMGANAAETMADAVRQAAEANELLTSNGRTIYLLDLQTGRTSTPGPSVLSPMYEDDWYHVPVRIPYYTIES